MKCSTLGCALGHGAVIYTVSQNSLERFRKRIGVQFLDGPLMAFTLHYGLDGSVRLELSDDVLVAYCGTPPKPSLDDPAAAAEEALTEPLDYPPLARITTPGDRITLALEPGVPRAAEIVAAAIRCLVAGGAEPDGLCVLQTAADAAGTGDPCRLVPEAVRGRIARHVHDPSAREQLAYLTTTSSGDPILLNRALHGADLVLPIGCIRRRSSAGYYGVHGAVYPTFSDQRTAWRFRSPVLAGANGQKRRDLTDEANEVGWLLGVSFTVQVVPGPRDDLLHVLAGRPESVARLGRRLHRAAWGCTIPRRAGLVVAGIEGGAASQTWRQLGNALAAASSMAQHGGAVVVCSELAAPPGPAVQRLAGARSRKAAMLAIRKDRPEDSFAAAQLLRAQRKGRVYLLSRLAPELVEELDITPVADAGEVVRLARLHDSCIMLANAPHVAVRSIPVE